MKIILLIASSIILSISCYAQKDTVGLNVPIQDGKIVYQGIVDIQGKQKLDLYRNAQQWFVDYFKSSKDVIQNQDKEDGFIIGKGYIIFNAKAGLGMHVNYP